MNRAAAAVVTVAVVEATAAAVAVAAAAGVETATKPSNGIENTKATSSVAFFFLWTVHCTGKPSSRSLSVLVQHHPPLERLSWLNQRRRAPGARRFASYLACATRSDRSPSSSPSSVAMWTWVLVVALSGWMVASRTSPRVRPPARAWAWSSIARYPLIRQLLGNAVQSMIMMPFDARELRQRLDELDLGF